MPFAGLIGAGFASGAVVGNIFTSPSAQQAYSVAKAADTGAGVVFTYGNYAGDVMNFGMASERLAAEGIQVNLRLDHRWAGPPHNQGAPRRPPHANFVRGSCLPRGRPVCGRGTPRRRASAAAVPAPDSFRRDRTARTRCLLTLGGNALGELPNRCLVLARHEPKAVDAVVKFARCTPRAWQTTVALTWIETIIVGRFDLIANHVRLHEEWLIKLCRARALVGGVKSHSLHSVNQSPSACCRSVNCCRTEQLRLAPLVSHN